MEVYVGIKKCGCLVAISDEKEWLEGDYDISKMDLEEARNKLKKCKCEEVTKSQKGVQKR